MKPVHRSTFGIPLRPEHRGLQAALAALYGVAEPEVVIDLGFSYLTGGRLSALVPARGLFLRLAPLADRREVAVRHTASWAILRRLGPPHAAGLLRSTATHLVAEFALVPGTPAAAASPPLIAANLETLGRLITVGQALGLEREGRRLVHHDLGPANTLVDGGRFHTIDYDSIAVRDVDWALGRLALNAMLHPPGDAEAGRMARVWAEAVPPILRFAARHGRMRDARDLGLQVAGCIAALHRWMPRFAPYGQPLVRPLAVAAEVVAGS